MANTGSLQSIPLPGSSPASQSATLQALVQAVNQLVTNAGGQSKNPSFVTPDQISNFATVDQANSAANTAESNAVAAGKNFTINNNNSTSYTLALTDNNTFMVYDAAAGTWTIPPNSSVAFAVGARIWIENQGGSTLTIAAGVGVTVNNTTSATVPTVTRKLLVQTAANFWTLI